MRNLNPPPSSMPLAEHRCWTEFSPITWLENAESMANLLHSNVSRLIFVVKANAYGQGVHLIPSEILDQGAGVGVATPEEATSLRECGFPGKIYLLSPTGPWEMAEAVAAKCIPLISTRAELQAWQARAKTTPTAANAPWPINLELDTGMGRSGVISSEDALFAEKWQEYPLELDSISSHFASADEDSTYTEQQEQNFLRRVNFFKNSGLCPQNLHIANSAGVMSQAQPQPRLARCGISLAGYRAGFGKPRNGSTPRLARCGISLAGYSPLPSMEGRLRPALSWHARVLLVRTLAAGSGVSYGSTYHCPTATRVATVGVGYADGYPRGLSGKGAQVLINGQCCAVLGRITMDQIIVDVSHLPEDSVFPGSMATLLGRDGEQRITADDLARLANTIPYEILTSIGNRVVRLLA